MSPHALVLAFMVLALCGCASAPASGPAAALTAERQWLQSWFKGTPVRIAQDGNGAVGVEVPREFCFDPGRSQIKPPLAAVLDKVAESLRRNPPLLLGDLAAPGDGDGASPLAVTRAKTLRTRLLTLGVRAAQIGEPRATSAAAVQLRLQASAP